MTDEPTNLVLEQLRAIRAERALTNTKIGALAESMVGMRKRQDTFGAYKYRVRFLRTYL